jgi:septal ring factor EnvC (AmiA/AmiB activator)
MSTAGRHELREPVFDRHISLGSILSALTALGAVFGVYVALRSDVAVQKERSSQMELRITRLEENRESDRKDIQQSLNRIEQSLKEIEVTLATKQDIRDQQPRFRPGGDRAVAAP